MKNKKLTYLLLLLVISLWGYLIYKVFGAVSSNNEHTSQTSSASLPVEDLAYYRLKNPDSLHLNYRDPLYSTAAIIKATPSQDIAPSTPVVQEAYYPPPAVVYEAVINYNGFIENENTKKRIAIINIDNKQYMIGPGETQQEVKVLEIHQSHVRIKHKGKTKDIHK